MFYKSSIKTYWLNRIDLPMIDLKRFKYFIEEERKYYNHLVTSLAGPMRSMPETIAKLLSLEPLIIEIARHETSVRNFDVDNIPRAFKRFKDTLFDVNGKKLLSDRELFLLDIFAFKARIVPEVRRDIAIAVLHETIKHSQIVNSLNPIEYIIESLFPIDTINKRHIQISKHAIKVVGFSEDKRKMTLKIPYFETLIEVKNPHTNWNYAFIRVDSKGNIFCDLSQEHIGYTLRKIDKLPYKNKKAKKNLKFKKDIENVLKYARTGA